MRNVKRSRLSYKAATLLTLGGLLLSACGSDSESQASGSAENQSGGEYGDTLISGVSLRATSLDPHNGGPYDQPFTSQIFDTLIAWDKEGRPVPGLATEWEFSDDALTLTLTLREGVKFQDGADLTAEAVKLSLERAMAEDSVKAPDLATVESVEAVDETTVRLNFDSPSAHILNALGNEAGMIISPEIVDGEVNAEPIGAGPYRLVSHSPDEVRYEAWEGYWDAENVKTPNVTIRTISDDTARVRALTSGEVHISNMRPSQIPELEAGGAQIASGATDRIYYALLNTSVEGLDQPEVRSALMQAIDRESINETLQDGMCDPVVQPYSELFPGHVEELTNDEGLNFDPEAARSQLQDAGFDESNPLTVELKSANISAYEEMAQVLQDQFSQIGVNATVVAADSAQMSAAVRQGDFEIYVGPSDTYQPDATSYLYTWYLRDAPWTENYAVPNGEELLLQARTATTDEDESETLQELVSATYEEAPPILPICAPHSVYVAGQGVEGLEVPASGTLKYKEMTAPK